MPDRRRFVFCLAAGLVFCLAWRFSSAEVIYPLISDEREVKRLAQALNKQNIKIAKFALEGSRYEKVKFDRDSFTFTVEEIGGPRYTFYKMDINNDGQDEYVLTEKGDVGLWFDIVAVYRKEKGKLRDIYEEIRLPLRALLREAQGATYNLEEGFVGISRGDMIVEEEGGRVYFSLVESHGSWLYCPKQKNLKCRWVRENCPLVYKFIWDADGLRRVRIYQRCLKGSDFRQIERK